MHLRNLLVLQDGSNLNRGTQWSSDRILGVHDRSSTYLTLSVKPSLEDNLLNQQVDALELAKMSTSTRATDSVADDIPTPSQERPCVFHATQSAFEIENQTK